MAPSASGSTLTRYTGYSPTDPDHTFRSQPEHTTISTTEYTTNNFGFIAKKDSSDSALRTHHPKARFIL
jgi:hypothetical protein